MEFYETSAKDNVMVEEAYFAMVRRIVKQVDEDKGPSRAVVSGKPAEVVARDALLGRCETDTRPCCLGQASGQGKGGHFWFVSVAVCTLGLLGTPPAHIDRFLHIPACLDPAPDSHYLEARSPLSLSRRRAHQPWEHWRGFGTLRGSMPSRTFVSPSSPRATA